MSEELPPPSAELVLLRVFVTAYLSTVTPKRAKAFMREAARLLENEETVAQLLPIRPGVEHHRVAKARREAVSMFRQLLPTFIASLPGEE